MRLTRKIGFMCLLAVVMIAAQPSFAQKKTTKKPVATQKRAPRKPVAKPAQKKSTKAKPVQKKASTKKKTTTKKAKTETYTNSNIKNLQNQRQEIQKKIRKEIRKELQNRQNKCWYIKIQGLQHYRSEVCCRPFSSFFQKPV